MRCFLAQLTRKPAYLALASVLAAATACAPTPHLNTPNVTLPAAFETQAPAEARTLDRWWDDFHDPQLTQLIETAFARSTTARMAYAKIAEARALRSQTRATTGPSGSLNTNTTLQGTQEGWGASVTQSGYQTGLANFSASWEVDLFGRLKLINRRADLNAQSAWLDYYGTRQALAADVANALFQARSLALQLADAQENQHITSLLAKASALGLAHGITSGQDAARLDADAASGEAELARLNAALQTAKRSLLILTGNPTAPTQSLVIDAALNAPPPLPAETPGALLARRPDVLSSGIAMQSAATKLKIDRLALFPKFSILPGVGLSATQSSAKTLIQAGGTGFWSLAAGMMLPILDRRALMANLRLSEAQGQESVISYERTVQAAYGEAENALTTVDADQRRTALLERASRGAKQAYDAARKGYTVGLTDLTTLLQSERTYIQNRAALNSARLGWLVDSVNGIRALGGGWNPNSDLNAPLTSGTF